MKVLLTALLVAVALPLVGIAGASLLVTAGAAGAAGDGAAVGVDVLVERLGWSRVLASAAAAAITNAETSAPGCRPRLALVAAVLEVEANGGRGRAISETGEMEPKVIGPALDGSLAGAETVRDTDAGRWDGDPAWDHAVGVAQFLPGTWAAQGIDASGDSVADPHNVYDAITAQVAQLCRTGSLLLNVEDERRSLLAYNRADWYVRRVMATADVIQELIDAVGAARADAATTFELETVGGITVARHIAPDLERLLSAARSDGIALGGSGYRSAAQQAALRSTNGCPDVDTAPAKSCRVPTAVPGRSKHETGQAVDFTENGRAISYGSRAFAWLSTNAASFGFTNLPGEPWHWSASGPADDR